MKLFLLVKLNQPDPLLKPHNLWHYASSRGFDLESGDHGADREREFQGISRWYAGEIRWGFTLQEN